MACLIGVSECSSDDLAKFRNVPHVNAPHCRIKRESPARGSVSLFLHTKNADKVLIVERCDDERMIRKPGLFHYPVDFGFAGEMGNVKLAVAERFHVWQRGPDQVIDAGVLGSAYRSGCLLDFVGSLLRKIGDQEYAVYPFKCSRKGFGSVQVGLNHFVGEFAMLGRITSQGAYLESIAGSKGANYGASLLPRCSDY